MTLETTLARLDARINWERRDRSAGMRVALEPALDLVARLGNPQEAASCVHVTGSKGKGSVCALVASGLREAGLRVGRYGSPHVERMNERIEVDGQPIGDEALATVLERVLAVRELAEREGAAAAEASWFDLVTAAALVHFAEVRVDWMVLEVGLGGRLDSTNVARGEVCVVTSIALEHTNVLGPTRSHVAREKAGIFKPGSAFVSGVPLADEDDDPGAVLLDSARELGIDPIVVAEAAAGPVADRNVALAGAVLEELNRRGRLSRGRSLLTPGVIDRARLPGRMEWRSLEGVAVLLDGAHTPASVALALEEGHRVHESDPVVVLSLGMDKDVDGILKALSTGVDRLVCTAVASGLHRPAEDLCDRALDRGFPAEAASDPSEALQLAVARRPGWVLVTGSLYVVGAVRGALLPLRAPETPA